MKHALGRASKRSQMLSASEQAHLSQRREGHGDVENQIGWTYCAAGAGIHRFKDGLPSQDGAAYRSAG